MKPPGTPPLTATEGTPASESGAGGNMWLYLSITELIKKGETKKKKERQLVVLEVRSEFHRIHNTTNLLR